MEPSLKTLKRLFAISCNRCAFPDCDLPIVEGTGTVTGIVCHIKARNRKGPRYDASQSEEERHAFANLVLMCARHSKVIDSEPERFTVETIGEIKELHERGGGIDLSFDDVKRAESLLTSYRSIYIHTKRATSGCASPASFVIWDRFVYGLGRLPDSICEKNFEGCPSSSRFIE